MIIRNKTHGCSSQRKYIQGAGFTDSLRSIGSYIYQNKDLITKPLLGAAGDLAAFGLTEGGKAVLTNIINTRNKKVNNNNNNNNIETSKLDSKSRGILNSIINSQNPTTNIIGSGIKRF